jgi:hypothetical protein
MFHTYNQEDIDNHYKNYYNQVGNGYSFTPYQGIKYQKGHGFLGSLFSNIAKAALPIAKKLVAPVGKTLLQTGINITKDKLAGKTFKDAIKSNLKAAGGNIIQTSYDTITGKTRKVPNKRKRQTQSKLIKRKARRLQTTKSQDIFD